MRAAKDTTPRPRVEGTVTSLTSKRGRTDRLVVYLDGERAFDVAAEVADRAALRVGVSLSVQAQETLLTEDAPYRARERALRWLALRDRASSEVVERLRGAGFESEVVSGTVDWLRGLGYLDDARFAAGYVLAKARSGWGRRRISAELLAKGLERRVVDEALSALNEIDDETTTELDAALEVARRRFGRAFEEDSAGAARRLAGFLGRRGYDWDVIHAVTRKLREETAGESDVPLP